MTREILFRGKKLDNGEWVYGYLAEVAKKGTLSIGTWENIGGEATVKDELFSSYKRVDPETVGQKSGLKEHPGTKDIWQGDVVKFTLVSFISGKPIATETHMVELRDGMFGVEWGNDKHFMPLAYFASGTIFAPGTIIEVIGTIHDNPELLEV